MLKKKMKFSVMNASIFASLLLIFSTTVLANAPVKPTQQTVPGGYMDADVNSKEIKTLAQAVLTQIQSVADASFDCVYRIRRVFSAQVLASAKKIDVRKIFKLEICPKTCINDIVRPQDCRYCTVEVLHLPWVKILQIKKFKCKPTVLRGASQSHATANFSEPEEIMAEPSLAAEDLLKKKLR